MMLVTLAACTISLAIGDDAAATAPLRVGVSSPLIADWVAAVGGSMVQVTTLGATGADAHHWEPAPSDAAAARSAAVTFVMGLGTDSGVAAFTKAAGGSGPVVELGAGLARPGRHARDEHDDHHHDGPHDRPHDDAAVDPHIWHDPQRVSQMIDRIEAALAAARTDQRGAFAVRATAYKAELAALDKWIREQIELVPAAKRVIVSTHDGLSYFAERYGCRVVGTDLSATSGHADPSPKSVAQLVHAVRESGARAVIADPAHGAALARTVAREAAVAFVDCVHLDSLPSRAKGDTTAPLQAGTAYGAMMRANTLCIVEALRP